MTPELTGGKLTRECLPEAEEADSGPGGLMNWFYMGKLAAPAGEVKEMWICPATHTVPLTAVPEMSGSSEPAMQTRLWSSLKASRQLCTPRCCSMWLGRPRV